MEPMREWLHGLVVVTITGDKRITERWDVDHVPKIHSKRRN